MESCFYTDRGKVRQHNEDSGGIFHYNDHFKLAIVADGMGGHKSGDVASQMTITEFKSLWDTVERLESPEQIEAWLDHSVKIVNQRLFDYAAEHEECKGMGTTLVAAICTDEFVTIGHIGDSRCYVNNGNGFSQITNDHSLVNELVRSGQISKEDAEVHPRKNVLLRALGTEKEVDLDITTINWEKNDSILICSDGLTNKVSDSELEETLNESKTIDEKAKYLIDRANELGGEDNISLAIIKLKTTAMDGDESEVNQ